jgi:gelsolin
LDVFLSEIPIQHREVQHYETDLFKSYFKELIYLKGGIDSGFQRVAPSSYKPRMFIVHNLNKKLITEEIELSKENLNSDDSFILDLGEELFVLQGKNSQAQEKYQANITAGKIKAERMGQCKVAIVTEEEWSCSEVVKGVPEGGEKFERRAGVEKVEKVLLRLRDKV